MGLIAQSGDGTGHNLPPHSGTGNWSLLRVNNRCLIDVNSPVFSGECQTTAYLRSLKVIGEHFKSTRRRGASVTLFSSTKGFITAKTMGNGLDSVYRVRIS
jgi:hypothetical protein